MLTDPFDYEAEDRLIDAWLDAVAASRAPPARSRPEPGYGLAYSGPVAARSKPGFET